jgi:chorismate mutase
MRELPVPNSLEMCVRVMMHVNTAVPQEEIVHVYLGGAKVLRPDLGNTLAK